MPCLSFFSERCPLLLQNGFSRLGGVKKTRVIQKIGHLEPGPGVAVGVLHLFADPGAICVGMGGNWLEILNGAQAQGARDEQGAILVMAHANQQQARMSDGSNRQVVVKGCEIDNAEQVAANAGKSAEP